MESVLTFAICYGIVCLSGVCVMLAFEHGLLDHFQSILQLKRISTLAFTAIEMFLRGRVRQDKVSVVPSDTGLSTIIQYNIAGNSGLITLPRCKDRNILGKMKMWKVFLHRERGEPLDITHPVGSPYLCSARMLGGCKISTKHLLGLEPDRIYDIDQIPGWLHGLDASTCESAYEPKKQI